MPKRIKLTQGKYAIVDDDMFDYLNQWKWYYSKFPNRRTVAAWIKGNYQQPIYMHRQIMSCPPGLIVDHRNHNGLDNQRRNLRICTNAENIQNQRIHKGKKTSKYKGVIWARQKQKWRADIQCLTVRHFIGLYKTEIQATKAYDARAKKLFGEYAYLNFKRTG